MSESELPLTFEKTIVGDVVAYIDLKGQNASFLKFPELAKAERATFESLWARTLAAERNGTGTVSAGAAKVVPLGTRMLSNLRQFFLGKRSLAALFLFAILSGMLTFGLYKTNRELNLQRIKDKVLSIASTGALQFDALDIDAVWKPEDITKPQYAKIIATLNLIRRSNTDIQYAYIMRETKDPTKLSFVADADSLYPNQRKDLNGDGIINDADALSPPGEFYDDDEFPLVREGLLHPIAGIGTDQWGTFISGQAPIRDKNGNAVAILGIDMFASNLDRFSASSFTPLYAFFGFFLLFMLIRFWFENRSLMEECFEVMKKNIRKTVVWIAFFMTVSYGIIFAFQQYKNHMWLDATGERLKAIAVTAATEFDPADLQQLHWARDMKTEAYQRVFRKLNEIRDRTNIKWAYIVRPTTTSEMYEFVADADANYNLPNLWTDTNYDGILDSADLNVWPGVDYFNGGDDLFALSKMKPSYGFSNDQWGYYLSGLAPIYDANKELVGFLGLDMDVEN